MSPDALQAISALTSEIRRLANSHERLVQEVDALTTDVRNVLLLRHEVTRLRDRVIELERHRDSYPPPTNGEAA